MMLPENVERALQHYRQHKNSFDLSRIKPAISRTITICTPQQNKRDLILNRKFQSENLMRLSKRRQNYQNIKEIQRRKLYQHQNLTIDTVSLNRKSQSMTLQAKQPIHTRRKTFDRDTFEVTFKPKREHPESKQFQHLLSITNAI